ncbi:hypothetical protein QQP08_018245, partial [Theobroma cacao]
LIIFQQEKQSSNYTSGTFSVSTGAALGSKTRIRNIVLQKNMTDSTEGKSEKGISTSDVTQLDVKTFSEIYSCELKNKKGS